MSGHVVVIDGPVGAGKSTLGLSIVRYCHRRKIRALLFHEEITPEFLALMLESPAHRFAFQASVLTRKVATMKHALHLAAHTDTIVVIDRGLVGDFGFAQMLHEKGELSEREWDVYCSLMRQAPTAWVHSSAVREACKMGPRTSVPACRYTTVLLAVSPEKALERTRARDNQAEVKTYDLAYFAHLHATYAQLFSCGEATVVDYSPDEPLDPKSGLVADDVVARFLNAAGVSLKPTA